MTAPAPLSLLSALSSEQRRYLGKSMGKTVKKRPAKKPAKSRRALKKLTTGVPSSVVRALDRQVRELRESRGTEWSRSDLIRLAIGRLIGKEMVQEDVNALYLELHERISPLKSEALKCLDVGKPHLARSLYLRAASLELEALSLLDDPDENIVKSALLETLVLLKEGTGYRHLPEVPGGKRTVRSFQ